VYERYLLIEDGARKAPLEAAGVTDAATFADFYWTQQFSVAGLLVVMTAAGGVGGALLYGVSRRKPSATNDRVPTAA
jgi:hypothetical protein